MYTYPWYHWITFFFLYSFFGWIFESAYVSLKKRRFVNRGFLRLPLLPLYGTGAVMMLWLSLPVKDHVVLVYFSGVVGATVLEYVTGFVMERLFKMKYWDYSNQKFNLNGYICLSSSVAWGFLTIFLTEVIHRPVADLVLGIDPRIEFPALGIVGAAFVADTVVSVKEALNLAKVLETMTRMKAEIDDAQVQAALLRAEIEQKAEELKAAVRADAASRAEAAKEDLSSRVAEILLRAAEARDAAGAQVEKVRSRAAEAKDAAGAQVEKVRSRAAEAKGAAGAQVEKVRSRAAEARAEIAGRVADAETFIGERLRREEDLTGRVHTLRESRQKLLGQTGFYRRNLLRGNPSATSARFAEALEELRRSLEKKQ